MSLCKIEISFSYKDLSEGIKTFEDVTLVTQDKEGNDLPLEPVIKLLANCIVGLIAGNYEKEDHLEIIEELTSSMKHQVEKEAVISSFIPQKEMH